MINQDKTKIRNFQLMKHIFDNLDIVTTSYNISKNAISVIQQLCLLHNSFKPYIEFQSKDFTLSRKSFYRTLEKLENENIIKVVSKPINSKSIYQAYFTLSFIRSVCEPEFAIIYEDWTNQFNE